MSGLNWSRHHFLRIFRSSNIAVAGAVIGAVSGQSGADVDALSPLNEKQANTPLYMARLYGRQRIVELLRMLGAADLDPETLADVELTESIASAAMELARKKIRDMRLARKIGGNLQEGEKRSFVAIAEAVERTLRKHSNFADLESIQQYRERYLAAPNFGVFRQMQL